MNADWIRSDGTPRYAFGTQWPEDNSPHFVVRLSDPFVLARIEIRGNKAHHLHVGTDIRNGIAPEVCEQIMADLARCMWTEYTRENAVPSSWSYTYGSWRAFPEHVILNGFAVDWTGILRTKNPAGLWTVDEDTEEPRWLEWLWGGEVSATEEEKAAREVAAYFKEYAVRQLAVADEKGLLD